MEKLGNRGKTRLLKGDQQARLQYFLRMSRNECLELH